MALQVVSILSSSKGALEVDGDIIKDPSPSSGPTAQKHSDHKGSDSPSMGSKFSSSKSQHSRFGKASTSASATKAVDGGGGVGGATGEVTPLNKYFRTFLVELLRMFETDRSLLDNKGSFVIR